MSEIIDPISTAQRIVRSSLYNFDEGYDIYNSLLFRTDPCYKST